jgi:hypothetical protein
LFVVLKKETLQSLSNEFSPPLSISGKGSLREIVKSLFWVQQTNFLASLNVNLGFSPHFFKYEIASASEEGVLGLSFNKT